MFTQILVLIQVKNEKKKIDFILSVFRMAFSNKNPKIQANFTFLKILQFNERISGMKKIAGSAFRLAAWMYDDFIYIKI